MLPHESTVYMDGLRRRLIVSGMGGTSEHTCRKHSLIGTIGSKWLHVAKWLQVQDRMCSH